MITSIEIKQQPAIQIKYPVARKWNSDDSIWLFVNSNKAVLIQQGGSINKVGYFSEYIQPITNENWSPVNVTLNIQD